MDEAPLDALLDLWVLKFGSSYVHVSDLRLEDMDDLIWWGRVTRKLVDAQHIAVCWRNYYHVKEKHNGPASST